MAVKFFVFSLFIISAVSILVPVSSEQEKYNTNEQPQLVFYNSTMYTLTNKDISRIVNSSRAIKYKDRDVMHDGKIISKANDNTTNYLESDLIIRRDENYKFLNNVKYNKENNILLNTQELMYNTKTKIATNKVAFDGIYYDHSISGKSLYLDTNKSIIKANQTHFEVELSENKDK